MSATFRSLSDSEVRALAADMDRKGYAVLPHYVAPEDVEAARTFVRDEVERRGNQYFAFVGPEPVAHTLPGDLGGSAAFRDILTRLYTIGTGKAAPALPLYQVLRCVMGSRGLNESYRFHFDGYAVTALLPIVIPTGEGPSGDLIMFPNTRRVRKSAAVNVLEKAVYQNRYSQRMAAWLVRRGVLKPTKLRLVPGNIYLFWGYRTLHANEACLADRLRTTALFHFGDPHGGSGLVGAVNARASDRGVRARAA